jgi:catechol 2,3-dioxygenase-like lactoylglutathione lyase family enzyme
MFRQASTLFAAALLMFFADANAGETSASGNASLIGIDHIPVVVANLDKASDTYRRIGFSLKPGRTHENGLRNNHIKFKDGSGIELIAVPALPTDETTTSYSDRLREGEGPAYISFHARDTKALMGALNAADIGFENGDGVITLKDPQLSFVFFVRDNRSPSDKPEHFAHSNGAIAMTEVWLALGPSGRERLRKLLLSLGAVERTETTIVPSGARALASVFYVQNGRVTVLPERYRLSANRTIIGAKFRTHRDQANDGRAKRTNATVKPATAHGLWLRFEASP